MTRTRIVATVAAFAVLDLTGFGLAYTVHVVGWPAVTALLRAYGWTG